MRAMKAKKPPQEPLAGELMLSQEQLRAIGCLAIEVTRLEEMVGIVIQEVSGLSNADAETFTFGWMLDKKVEAMKTILTPRLKAAGEVDTFADLYARIKDLNTRRNTVIHGRWERTSSTDAVAIRTGRTISVKASEVLNVAHGIADCIIHLVLLHYRVAPRRAARPASP